MSQRGRLALQRGASVTVLALLCAAASLAGCKRGAPPPPLAALPATTQAAAALAPAPGPAGLPAAPPPNVVEVSDPSQSYAFIERAAAMSDAFGDSPPDYAFEDDGVTPWVWVADDEAECVAEPAPGGERYYYYEPGSDEPFFVQDPDYGYGYENGDLVVVYDRFGRELPPGAEAARTDVAGRYLARARLLRQSAGAAPRQAVAAANWAARRDVIAAQRTRWSREESRYPAWSAYHAQHAAAEQAHWASEAYRREAWAARTDARLGDQAQADHEQQLAEADARRPQPALASRPSLPPWPARGPAQPQTQALDRPAAALAARGPERVDRPGEAGRFAANTPPRRAAGPEPAQARSAADFSRPAAAVVTEPHRNAARDAGRREAFGGPEPRAPRFHPQAYEPSAPRSEPQRAAAFHTAAPARAPEMRAPAAAFHAPAPAAHPPESRPAPAEPPRKDDPKHP